MIDKEEKKDPHFLRADEKISSDLTRLKEVLTQGIIKTIRVGVDWIVNMPKSILSEKNTGLIKALHHHGVEPNDVVTFRLTMTGVALCIYGFVHKDTGALMYIGLNILDAVDGKLARTYDMSSPEGEKYDAGADKGVVIAGDMVALTQIADPVTALQGAVSYLINWDLLRQSFLQRGSLEEQLQLFKGLILGTITPTYQKVKTDLAASPWGKYKTIFQMVSNSALLASTTNTFQSVVTSQAYRDTFQAGCVTLSILAIALGYKSVQGRNFRK